MKIKFGLHEILSRISEPSAVFEADFEKQTRILHRLVHEPAAQERQRLLCAHTHVCRQQSPPHSQRFPARHSCPREETRSDSSKSKQLSVSSTERPGGAPEPLGPLTPEAVHCQGRMQGGSAPHLVPRGRPGTGAHWAAACSGATVSISTCCFGEKSPQLTARSPPHLSPGCVGVPGCVSGERPRVSAVKADANLIMK